MQSAILNALLVGTGGFIGSIFRYALSGAVHRFVPAATFPWGTVVVNVAGCLAIGFIAGIADSRQVLGSSGRVFLLIGLLGGFTTFSTFGYETMTLLRAGAQLKAFANVALQVVAGLSAVWLGLALAKVG